MNRIHDIRPVKLSAEADLLKRSGVTGVDIGKKIVKGQKTDELSIRVYVEKKKDVPKEKAIPEEIDGIKTDVIQRKFVLNPRLMRVADIQLKEDTATYDTLRGGISIGPCRSIYFDEDEAACQGLDAPGWYVFVGTLGAFVRDNDTNALMMLSNFHVMCVNDQWSAGDTIAQPSLVDGGNCPADVVGAVQRASLGGQVDCAVASHTDGEASCSIVDIGFVSGTADAAVDMALRKRGRTTELTHGIVDTVDLTVTLNYCDGPGSVTLTNQIGIEYDPAQSPTFGRGGDSGSVVVNEDNNVIGLYFAGTSEVVDDHGNVIEPEGAYGVANPIGAVLEALNVHMCVQVQKKMEPEKWYGSDIEQYKPEKYKPESYKPEKYKPEKYKPEKYKPEQYKPEQYKPEEHKPEQYKPEEHKPEKYKPEEHKPEKYKPEEHKPEQYKPEEYKPEEYKGELEKPEASKRDPGFPTDPGMPGHYGSIEQRLARIEAALSQMTHFISPEMRPDISRGGLHNERDLGKRKRNK